MRSCKLKNGSYPKWEFKERTDIRTFFLKLILKNEFHIPLLLQAKDTNCVYNNSYLYQCPACRNKIVLDFMTQDELVVHVTDESTKCPYHYGIMYFLKDKYGLSSKKVNEKIQLKEKIKMELLMEDKKKKDM